MTEKTRIEIALLLPTVPDARDACVKRLGAQLSAHPGNLSNPADVTLMADDLNHLPFVVGLSRQTSRIIRQNLWLSLGMVAFLVPATVLGLQLGPAVLLHEGSTVLVVFNALRLLAYPDVAASSKTASNISPVAQTTHSKPRQRQELSV